MFVKSGIPIPEPYCKMNSRVYGLVKSMQVGDCIDLPYSRKGVASNLGRSTGYTFTQRKIGDILRIWRTR